MIVLGYIGSRAEDTWRVKFAQAVIRWVQNGSKYFNVTHVESHLGGPWYNCRIGSSSFRDKGVRTKDNVELTRGNWIALNVPMFSIVRAEAWHTANNGKIYDMRGAIATVLWLLGHAPEEYICVEAVAIPQGIVDPHQLTTAKFMALCATLPGTEDITEAFFAEERK